MQFSAVPMQPRRISRRQLKQPEVLYGCPHWYTIQCEAKPRRSAMSYYVALIRCILFVAR
jgi:hypothetical protein